MADKNKDPIDDEVPAYTDETVAEFFRERQDRIAVRRARIGDKLAKKKEKNVREGSVASSLDFLSTPGDDGQSVGGAGAGPAGATTQGGVDSSAAGGKAKGSHDLRKSSADPLDIQIDESRKQLEQIILDGENLITNVRIAAECREKVRHQKETESRKERLERLSLEAEECQKMYDELKPNWNISAEKKLPMELFDGVKNQMQACEELIMKKQDLIASLQQELEENDFEYEQNLEMYQKDVSLIGDRIDDCVDEMQGAFLNELTLIEDYTCRNREVQLEENQREWMELLDEFEKMEEAHLEQRKQDALNKFQALNELYVNVKQEARANRHKFEDDLRILIQELEQIKYATQLNMEKLQYNLAIVRKRYKENVEMKNMMKRLLLKFNDRFTTKSKALRQKMEAGKREAKKILNDISKLEDSLDLFGRKTLHLAVSDWNKYMDLWAVSEEMVRDRVQRLLDSEKFIFETQLGIDAPMPELTFMDERPGVVTKYIMKKSSAYSELASYPESSKAPEAPVSRKSKKSAAVGAGDGPDPAVTEAKAQGLNTLCKNASLILLPSDSIEFVPGPEPDPQIQRELMKHVAKAICDESGFLVEEELRKLVEPLLETERNLVNLDALLKALGINSVEEMQYLAHFLLRRCRVTKGIISRIASQASAHVSEMNVSLTGIMGKNAVDDWESSTGSTPHSGTASVRSGDGGLGSFASDNEVEESPEFKKCECDKRKSRKSGGETTENAPNDATEATGIDDVDDTMCSLLPELKGLDEQQLTLGDFKQELVHCSPKCCSVDSFGEEETIETAIVTLEGDDEMEEVLEQSGQEEEIEVEPVVSKCSTCGGEPHDHQDCSFRSSEASVYSWVDPEDPPNKERRDKLKQTTEAEEITEEQQTTVESQTTLHVPQQLQQALEEGSGKGSFNSESTGQQKKQSASKKSEEISVTEQVQPTSAVPAVQDETAAVVEAEGAEPIEVLREPVIIFSDFQTGEPGEPESAKFEGEAKVGYEWEAVEEAETLDTISVISVDSSTDSDEFMYIEPAEVIEALTEFCKEYNAKITVELPSLDELIDRKLNTFKYPGQSSVMEYWDRPLRMLSVKSDDLWEGMQYSFEEFNGSLKKRNALVDQVLELYRKNYELSFLMKDHIATANRRFLPKPTGSGTRFTGSYC